jgi:Host cell surface-exposed lipoprotein
MSTVFVIVFLASIVGVFKPYIPNSKRWHFGLGAFFAFFLIGITAPNLDSDGMLQQTSTVSKSNINTEQTSETPSTSIKTVLEQESPQVDVLTGPQRNAVRSAEQYLAMTGFSRKGLIEQLSSDAGEGYSVADATVAVDSLNVDWKENAARSAREYLNMTGFSCKGLIEQLSSSAGSDYTVAEATYGANEAGAC